MYKRIVTTLVLAALSIFSAVQAEEVEYDLSEVVTHVEDNRWFLSLHGGVVVSDDSDFDNGPSFGLSLGKPFRNTWGPGVWALEGTLRYDDLGTENAGDYERLGISAQGLWFPFNDPFIYPSDGTHYFAMAGIQGARIEWLGEEFGGYGPMLGLGILMDWDWVRLRADLRYRLDDVSGTGPVPDDTYYTWAPTVGLTFPLGAAPTLPDYDSDNDGVPNNRDKCPNTPPGVKVGPDGCPLDSDGDGVPDTYDKCPDTPPGVVVDADGCPLDSDGDGVPDSRDKCPDTPEGVIVNADGCPLDSDGDGVPDGIDQCPGTLPGLEVNSKGCVIPQVFELRGVHFEFDKSRLLLDSKVILDRVAESLMNEPDVKIMIAGHTDWIGSDAYNMKLSQARAQSVVDYLASKGIPIGRMTARGFGESQPVETNETDAGREHNRRVELHILEDENTTVEAPPPAPAEDPGSSTFGLQPPE